MSNTSFKVFTCSYKYKGKSWCVSLPAEGFEDAEARLSALHFGRVDGEIVAEIPANPATGVLVRVASLLRNLLFSRA